MPGPLGTGSGGGSGGGVTSLVAGTNVSVSGATGAVTVNAPAFGTTIAASTIGGTAAAGTSTSVAREDHKHAFPSGAAPASLLVASTQVMGTSASPALADHIHAMPGSAVAGASAVGDTAATGSATTLALSDHRHSREAFGTPIAVTGGATAASGSATTIARSDHVHSTASMPVLLASTTLTSAAASITFSSIPSTYRSLRLIFSGAVTASVGWSQAGIRFNGDTASNYYFQVSSTVYTSAYAGLWTGATTGGGGSGASYSGNDLVIYDYAASNRRKLIVGLSVADGAITSTPVAVAGFYFTLWAGNAAITSITLIDVSASTIAAGSTAAVYGMP